MLAIATRGLSRRFGKLAAVSDVDLDVPEGAVFDFLGRNGAGKTTTIRLLLGLLRPSGGIAEIFGIDIRRRRLEAARLMGSLVEAPSTMIILPAARIWRLPRGCWGRRAARSTGCWTSSILPGPRSGKWGASRSVCVNVWGWRGR